ncbi:MAG TPA: hypothetical protein VLS89_08350 [Candidatus Nanopelagicales bacterium]|nr:hypothetical protein [Candidatus Nanopelagicales bacterium]
MRITLHRAAALGLIPMLFGAGCDSLSFYPEDCADELKCPGTNCPGACVPLPPLGFDGPALLWFGPEAQAPECPARAPVKVYEGYGDLQASHECPPCACSQPTCQLPAGVTASDTASCQGPGFTAFDAPAAWSGACLTAPSVIGSSDLRSVTLEPVTERPCEPVPQPVPTDLGPFSWSVIARACRGEAIDTVCGDPGLTCLPSAEPPPPGFRQCIMHLVPDDGSGVQCPADYPDLHVFYASVEDERACTECTCTQTAPPQCEVLFSTYQDQTCGQVLLSTVVATNPTACWDIASPTATLGSMAATWTMNEPGSCEPSGGASIGEVKPKGPRTFCCQPPPGE